MPTPPVFANDYDDPRYLNSRDSEPMPADAPAPPAA